MEPTRLLAASTNELSGDDENLAMADALAPDTILNDGNFQIVKPLGQGGFGLTYLARDLMLDRAVVIKECFPDTLCYRNGIDLAVRSQKHVEHWRKCVDMFKREARSIAKLAHPNIVNVYTVFDENETAYMVLDLVDGQDLLDIIEDDSQEMSSSDVVHLLGKVLDALAVVHENNMLHRDISPDNILVDHFGEPTLIDFGSARESASERTRVNTAFLFVKDGYSPFEFYVEGAEHSPASDLYALGGTFYHLIAGEAPPSGQQRPSEIQAGRADPYRPLVGRFPAYDDVFLAAIDKALALPQKERMQSAAQWHAAIADLGKGPVKSRPKPSGPRPALLGQLVSETNKHVFEESAPVKAKSEPTFLQEAVPDLGASLKWREEFNQETQDSYVDDDGDTFIEPTPASQPTKFVDDLDDDELDDSHFIVRASQVKGKKGKSSTGSGFYYLLSCFVVIVLAVLLSVNYNAMREDGSWTVMFSMQGLCREDGLAAFLPVPVDCSGRTEARRLDLDSGERILRLHTTDQFR